MIRKSAIPTELITSDHIVNKSTRAAKSDRINDDMVGIAALEAGYQCSNNWSMPYLTRAGQCWRETLQQRAVWTTGVYVPVYIIPIEA